MTFKEYFTTEKLNELKQLILNYFPTSNNNLFNLFYSRVDLVTNRLYGVTLLYGDTNILDSMFINAIVNVLDKKWLYLLKLQASINTSIDSLENLNVKTSFLSNLKATLATNGTNNDTGTSNSRFGTGYKGFDSINNDASFSVDKDDKSYSNNRSFNTNNNETRGLTSEKVKQDLDQYLALFNSTMEEINRLIFNELISLCDLYYMV